MTHPIDVGEISDTELQIRLYDGLLPADKHRQNIADITVETIELALLCERSFIARCILRPMIKHRLKRLNSRQLAELRVLINHVCD